MIRRNAACASVVTVSASSRIIILKGGLGYLVSFSTSIASASSVSLVLKKDPFLRGACPTARLAKCLIFSLTTDIPRSSLALSSSTRRRHWEGSHN